MFSVAGGDIHAVSWTEGKGQSHRLIAYSWGEGDVYFKSGVGHVSRFFAPKEELTCPFQAWACKYVVCPKQRVSPIPPLSSMHQGPAHCYRTRQHCAQDEDAQLLHIAELQLLHEATLQDLIHTWNYAVDNLLSERNQLLQER